LRPERKLRLAEFLDALPEVLSRHRGGVATLRAKSLARKLELSGQAIGHFSMLLPLGYAVVDALSRVWVLEAKLEGRLWFRLWRFASSEAFVKPYLRYRKQHV